MSRKAGWLYNKTSMDFSDGKHGVIYTNKIQFWTSAEGSVNI